PVKKSKIGQTPFDQLPVAVQRQCVQLQLMAMRIEADYDLVEHLRLNVDITIAVGLKKLLGSVGGERERGRGGETKAEEKKEDDSRRKVYALRDSRGMVHLRQSEPAHFKSQSQPVQLRGNAGGASLDGVQIRWRIEPEP